MSTITFLQPAMRQNHSNYSAPINLQSPIGIMPFGKHKGEVIWTLGFNTLVWMESNFNLTDIGKETVLEAVEIGNHQGEYAVLRKLKYPIKHVRIQGFYSSKIVAENHCDENGEYSDFVYHIVEHKI